MFLQPLENHFITPNHRAIDNPTGFSPISPTMRNPQLITIMKAICYEGRRNGIQVRRSSYQKRDPRIVPGIRQGKYEMTIAGAKCHCRTGDYWMLEKYTEGIAKNHLCLFPGAELEHLPKTIPQRVQVCVDDIGISEYRSCIWLADKPLCDKRYLIDMPDIVLIA